MVRIIDPRRAEWWDPLIQADPRATIFHSSSWARVVADTYGYMPRYLAAESASGWCVVPVMEVKDILRRRRGIGLPFSDAVPVLGDRGALRAETLEALVDYAERRRWQSVEIRDELHGITGAGEMTRYVHHQVKLDGGIDAVAGSLHDAIRRNIRKAERSGVAVSHSRDSDAMEGFFRLHCLTRRKHGIPPQPLVFFRNLWKEIVEPGNGFVTSAFFQGRLISAAVFLLFGGTAVFKFGASVESRHPLRANNLVMWRSMQKCMEAGCRLLSLGRSDAHQDGLIRYKDGWGGEKRPCTYTVWGGHGRSSTTRRIAGAAMTRVARRLPIPVLRLLGEIAYRHLA
jgi:hypothetical protein